MRYAATLGRVGGAPTTVERRRHTDRLPIQPPSVAAPPSEWTSFVTRGPLDEALMPAQALGSTTPHVAEFPGRRKAIAVPNGVASCARFGARYDDRSIGPSPDPS